MGTWARKRVRELRKWTWNGDYKCCDGFSCVAIAVLPGDRVVTGGTPDGKLKVWAIETGVCLKTIETNDIGLVLAEEMGAEGSRRSGDEGVSASGTGPGIRAMQRARASSSHSRLDGRMAAATLRAAPCRVIIVRNLEDFVWVGLVGIAHPYPKDAPAVFDRV